MNSMTGFGRGNAAGDNFSAAVRGEAELLLGRDHAAGQARILGALYESARSGREIAL